MCAFNQTDYIKVREKSLYGRYITNNHIEAVVNGLGEKFTVTELGRSVLNNPIQAITVGRGDKRILMWSQMHGNESTTTKAVFDFLNLLSNAGHALANTILDNCTISIIPILNPDGAERYTRFNANNVDLNRDASALTQPESKLLSDYFKAFKPHFCFNLHGQRTIFGAGKENKSATVSFLSPSQDKNRSLTLTRKKAMEIIVAMYTALQTDIPEQIGIYDDGFNINCVGDLFQSLGVPTVLFEAGHYSNDYQREQVRFFICKAIVAAVCYISKHAVDGEAYERYLEIPQNEKTFFDIIVRRAKLSASDDIVCDVAIQYEEELKANEVVFIPIVKQIGGVDGYFGHLELDAQEKLVHNGEKKGLKVGFECNFIMIGNEKYSLK
ncbi:peptidase M14 [Mangrovimonas yunxiaonensis]|uniref:Peptidase M14 n=1 Tax=Mangrovimonas yunxiaonensis TaxID=1197477 RepID=A0A084THJ7_9FLAO|nr:M14 metallopeptidase family protein [Mangrovimonas yunxiaonensis]KFB00183.1 peptidase M14 [Mangrovimonas yunxiaonensis]GGH42387.1 peptidase M14 [Mangrovimonas yunxiaonensis]